MATKKEELQQSQQALFDFFSASKALLGDDAPYDINELTPDHPLYQDATEIVQEMELNWESMSHEDSNRAILNLLSDYFIRINPVENYKPVLTISFKKDK